MAARADRKPSADSLTVSRPVRCFAITAPAPAAPKPAAPTTASWKTGRDTNHDRVKGHRGRARLAGTQPQIVVRYPPTDRIRVPNLRDLPVNQQTLKTGNSLSLGSRPLSPPVLSRIYALYRRIALAM